MKRPSNGRVRRALRGAIALNGLLLLSSLVVASAAGDESRVGPWFGPGERCTFSIDYGVINAGEATLEVRDMIEYEGSRCFHIRTRARSNRFFSALFRVRDQADSFMDADSLNARYFNKHLREGDFQRDVEIHFDQVAHKVYFPDGRESDVVPDVQDVLSAFFRVRSLPLEPGAEFELPTYGDKELYPLRVKVHRRERVEDTKLGDVDCIVVQPFLEEDGLFKHEGDLLLWLTDDRRHIPVKLRANVPVGAIVATLKDYHPPNNPGVEASEKVED